jgi:hypothetical protein
MDMTIAKGSSVTPSAKTLERTRRRKAKPKL